MSQLTSIPRWAKRALAALLLAGALAAPALATRVQPAANQTAQTTHGALAVAPRTQCPGGLLFC
jgi:hypothetical protein